MIHLEIVNDVQSTATFIFPEGFLGFQGHFPGNPVLPGVCTVQAALVVLQENRKKAVRLEEMVSAKYHGSISCGVRMTMTCTETALEDKRTKVKVLITSGGKKISNLVLLIA